MKRTQGVVRDTGLLRAGYDETKLIIDTAPCPIVIATVHTPWRNRGRQYPGDHQRADSFHQVVGDFEPQDNADHAVVSWNCHDELVETVRDLLQFVPIEKPEEGPLPNWIQAVRGRAHAALARRHRG